MNHGSEKHCLDAKAASIFTVSLCTSFKIKIIKTFLLTAMKSFLYPTIPLCLVSFNWNTALKNAKVESPASFFYSSPKQSPPLLRGLFPFLSTCLLHFRNDLPRWTSATRSGARGDRNEVTWPRDTARLLCITTRYCYCCGYCYWKRKEW